MGAEKEAKVQVVPVFLTVDPERDGVKEVAEYVVEFHPRMVGLTGPMDKVGGAGQAVLCVEGWGVVGQSRLRGEGGGAEGSRRWQIRGGALQRGGRADWLSGCRLSRWLTGCVAGWLAGRPCWVTGLAGWLAGCWLSRWEIGGWLAGRPCWCCR